MIVTHKRFIGKQDTCCDPLNEIIYVLESKAVKCQPNSQRRQMICHKPIKFDYDSTSQQFVEPVTSN